MSDLSTLLDQIDSEMVIRDGSPTHYSQPRMSATIEEATKKYMALVNNMITLDI